MTQNQRLARHQSWAGVGPGQCAWKRPHSMGRCPAKQILPAACSVRLTLDASSTNPGQRVGVNKGQGSGLVLHRGFPAATKAQVCIKGRLHILQRTTVTDPDTWDTHWKALKNWICSGIQSWKIDCRAYMTWFFRVPAINEKEGTFHHHEKSSPAGPGCMNGRGPARTHTDILK